MFAIQSSSLKKRSIILLLFFLINCGGSEEQNDNRMCTAADCSDRLMFSVESPDEPEPSIDFAKIDGERYECENSRGPDQIECFGDQISIPGTSDVIDLVVEVTKGETVYRFEDTVEPDYEKVFPNGKDCPGECNQAEKRLTLKPQS